MTVRLSPATRATIGLSLALALSGCSLLRGRSHRRPEADSTDNPPAMATAPDAAGGANRGGDAPAAKKPSDDLDLRYANGVVAVVEDRAITVEDVRREMAPLIDEVQRRAQSKEQYEHEIEALKNDIIQGLIDRVLMVKEFRKDEKKHIPPNYIDEEIADRMIHDFDNDRSKFLAWLKARGKTRKEYRRDVEEDIICRYMRGQMHKSQSMVSPVKIETYYNENKDKFYQDDAVDLRLIQLNREKLTDDELREKATVIRNRIRKGEKFADVAKEVSQDARRDRGGDWGWQHRSDLRKEFTDQLFALKKGECTEPIILPEGAYILYVEDRKFAGIQPIDAVRDQIERVLVSEMTRTAEEKWLENLRRNGYVKYY